MIKTKRIYNNLPPNNPNPKLTIYDGKFCSKCECAFSFWDALNLSPKDTDLLCANCKGIEIEYVNNKD